MQPLRARAFACSLLAVACVAVAGRLQPARARAQTGPTRSIRQLETLMLGPEHAAEHAQLRQRVRAMARAWSRLRPAERRRIVGLAQAKARAQARAADTLDPAVYGQWTQGPFRLPVHAIHVALLPTGKVVFFAFPFYPEASPPTGATTSGDAWTWNPSTSPDPSPSADPANEPGVFTHVPPPFDPETGGTASLFCAGLSLLPNGDMFVTGGTLRFPSPNSPVHYGLRRAYTFDPWTEAWIQQPDMQHGRWYPSHVELPDGRVAVLAGLDEGGVSDNPQLEIFTPTEDPAGVGTWQYAPQGNRETDLYPHLTLLGNGKVLLAGPGPDDSGVLDPATMTWTSAPGHGPRRMYGTELLDPNGTGPSLKVTEIGGFADKTPPGQTTYPPTNTSQTLDLGANPLQWTAAPSLNVARANHNTLWLPDGTMLTVGGGNGRFNGSTYELQPGKPEHQVELFNPASGQWVLGPAQQIDRAYHSTALLLPDGRVLSAGDDNAYVTGQPYEGSAHNSAEIYSPPYLFRGPRPSITSAPNGSLYNTPFRVSLANVDPRQAHAVLIPPGAITHSTNPNPRIVPLSSTPTASGLQLLAPANENIAPRGWYMLFVVNANGVPSVATWLRVGYPGSGGPPGTAQRPRVTRAVEWIRVARRQSFRKGYLVAYLGLALNKSTVRGSVLLPSGRGRRTTRTRLVATRVVHGAHAGTFKLVVRLRRSAVGRRRLRGRHKVVLRVQVSASGAPAYRGERTIVDKRR